MKKPNKNNRLKAIDFFCGAGGMTYGVRQAGFNVIAGIDIDADCRATYEYNNPGSKFIEANVKTLTIDQLKSLTKIKRNDDNMLFIACSPCQYWTNLRTDKTKSSKSKTLLQYFQKFVEHFNPGHIMIENVPGILTNSKASKLNSFINFLKKNNYTVAYDIVNAVDHGIPQTRKRFVLIASRVHDSLSIPVKKSKKKPTVRDFIGKGFPEISYGHTDTTQNIHTTAGLSEINIERLKHTPKNGGTRLSWKNNKKLQLKTYIGKDNSFVDTYGRLHWDKPASTITTKFFSISNGRFAHPTQDRPISLREGATLQTFPKSYIFKGSSVAGIAKQIGNAVPPKFAKMIAQTLTRS